MEEILDSADCTDLTEPLDKCCTLIIPKKRKRHFETKHRTSYFKAARLRRQQQQQQSLPSSNNIYINVEPPSNEHLHNHMQLNSTDGTIHETTLQVSYNIAC